MQKTCALSVPFPVGNGSSPKTGGRTEVFPNRELERDYVPAVPGFSRIETFSTQCIFGVQLDPITGNPNVEIRQRGAAEARSRSLIQLCFGRITESSAFNFIQDINFSTETTL